MEREGSSTANEELTNSENIFFQLLDDERMFNKAKFLKVLKQEKVIINDRWNKLEILNNKKKESKKKHSQKLASRLEAQDRSVRPAHPERPHAQQRPER